MYERFTERARQVVVLAQEEARTMRHGYIGTEHLLLGLIREEEGLAARILASLDVTLLKVREKIQRVAGTGREDPGARIPLSELAKKVLEISLREALTLGHNYIGTEHILLGLVRESEGVGCRILLDMGHDSEKIRREVIRLLSGSSKRVQHRDPELAPVVVLSDLTRPGDAMQSALSRLSEWVKKNNAPYEVFMACVEGDSAVNDWTETRRKM